MIEIPHRGWVHEEDRAMVEQAFPVGCEVEAAVEGEYGPEGMRGRVLGHTHFGLWHITVAWTSGPYLGEDIGWIANRRFRMVPVQASSVPASLPGFCSCPEPDFIRNCADGKWFEVCRRCKNERMP